MRYPFQNYITDVPDFPKEGILFKDITPLLASPEALRACITELESLAHSLNPTHIVGIESRGFIFGVPLAHQLGLPFIPARKPGKLPRPTHEVTYALEYGHDSLMIHQEDIPKGARVLIVDDLLATGGTASACGDLVKLSDAQVAGFLFVIELIGLEGSKKLEGLPHYSLLRY